MTGFARGSVPRMIVSAAVLAAVAGGVIYAALALNEYRVPFVQLWATLTAALLTWRSLRRVAPPPAGPDGLPDPGAAGRPPERPMPSWWAQRLGATSGDVEWFDRVVRARLVALVTERLRQHHGIPFTGDPDRVRAVLGDGLYDFLTGPLPRTPTRSELERLITRMEEI